VAAVGVIMLARIFRPTKTADAVGPGQDPPFGKLEFRARLGAAARTR